MIRSLLIITAFLLSLFSSQVPAAAVASLKNFVDKVQTFRAGFSQTLLDQNFRVLQKSGGSMLFARPGKFRWSYDTPYQQLIVGDGEQVWFYDQDLEQVTARKLDITLGSTPAALLAGGKTIEQDFDLQEIEAQGELEWLEASSKSEDTSFELIRLGFSRTGELREMILRDNLGQLTWLIFSQTEHNPALPDDLFQFTPPAGVDIIRD
ncbi:MAG: outer membrane lipoprotein chaperone LolA [Nitrosomonas sp.]|jgi:outer membrane lipoprotein carrier protein|nr:outer membrane lipoprotein chaperone LolA [Nitrosomonas sp.]